MSDADDLARENMSERAVWSQVMWLLTHNGTYATSEIEPAVNRAIADAEARGRRKGLEEAAKVCEGIYPAIDPFGAHRSMGRQCAAAIRAIIDAESGEEK